MWLLALSGNCHKLHRNLPNPNILHWCRERDRVSKHCETAVRAAKGEMSRHQSHQRIPKGAIQQVLLCFWREIALVLPSSSSPHAAICSFFISPIVGSRRRRRKRRKRRTSRAFRQPVKEVESFNSILVGSGLRCPEIMSTMIMGLNQFPIQEGGKVPLIYLAGEPVWD